MAKEPNKEINKKAIIDKDAYLFWVEKRKKYKKEYKIYLKYTGKRKGFPKIIKEIWKSVAEEMLERDGGVFIDSLGYFVNVLTPSKEIQTKSGFYDSEHLNIETESRVYAPAFLHTAREKEFRYFFMDKEFAHSYKQKLSKKIKSGKRYKNYFPMLHKMFAQNRNFLYKYKKL